MILLLLLLCRFATASSSAPSQMLFHADLAKPDSGLTELQFTKTPEPPKCKCVGANQKAKVTAPVFSEGNITPDLFKLFKSPPGFHGVIATTTDAPMIGGTLTVPKDREMIFDSPTPPPAPPKPSRIVVIVVTSPEQLLAVLKQLNED